MFRLLRRYRIAAIFVVFSSLFSSFAVLASDIVVGSWNIQRLGHGSQKSFAALATIAGKVDLLAVQEVMTEQGITDLERALEKHTGESWSHLLSHALGANSYKEHYAFIWRDSAVKYVDGAVVYLDKQNHFAREPFSARFQSKRDHSELAMATVHIVYGKTIKDRTPEINALAEYWLWMKEIYPNTPLVLAGDFNLDQAHAAWAPLKRYAKPLITQGASTLSDTAGKYVNLYDNIWVERDSHLKIKQQGVIDYPKLIGWDHSKSRKHVSDHAPIFMALGNSQFDNATASLAPFSQAPSNYVAPKKNPKPQVAASTQDREIRANKNSGIFHRADCPSYARLGVKNRVVFDSVQAAQQAGYRLAKNCP
ncbi:hypothetical protein CBP12_04835 [Oceanisphaera avium]|uniref:Uncharacterized protein n=2 Tax=Oceanisphaera avium TaxID=1903694 RepID=A0A1Y0D0L2_9GAMM|nr:hypothetical protein CBP12_04835 [Oceanisphaera avium]